MHYLLAIYPFQTKFDLGFVKIQSITYKEFEKFWGYTSKVILIARSILNSAARNASIVNKLGKEFPNNVRIMTTHAKLLSAINVPLNLVDISQSLDKMALNFWGGDREGLAATLLSLGLLAGDTFESCSTVINSGLTVVGSTPLDILAQLEFPLAFTLGTAGIFSRSFQIFRSCQFYRNLSPLSNIEEINGSTLKKEFEEALGFKEGERLIELIAENSKKNSREIEKLQMKRESVYKGKIPKESDKFLNYFSELNGNEQLKAEEIEIAKQYIDFAQRHLVKKIKVDLIAILTNCISMTALGFFAVGSAGSLPFLLLTVSFSIKLISLIYQDKIDQKHQLA